MAKPPPIPSPRDTSLGGWTDDLGDAAKWVLDKVVPLAEVIVPVVAPEAAPIVAAEHALRTGQTLSHEQAKAATVAATKVGKAVAASQQEPSGEQTSSTSSSLERTPASSSSTTWLVIGAIALAAYALSR